MHPSRVLHAARLSRMTTTMRIGISTIHTPTASIHTPCQTGATRMYGRERRIIARGAKFSEPGAARSRRNRRRIYVGSVVARDQWLTASRLIRSRRAGTDAAFGTKRRDHKRCRRRPTCPNDDRADGLAGRGGNGVVIPRAPSTTVLMLMMMAIADAASASEKTAAWKPVLLTSLYITVSPQASARRVGGRVRAENKREDLRRVSAALYGSPSRRWASYRFVSCASSTSRWLIHTAKAADPTILLPLNKQKWLIRYLWNFAEC